MKASDTRISEILHDANIQLVIQQVGVTPIEYFIEKYYQGRNYGFVRQRIENIKYNMLTLAEHLLSLPKDDEHFDMGVYFSIDGDWLKPTDVQDEFIAEHHTLETYALQHQCQTAACALGHALLMKDVLVREESFIDCNFKYWEEVERAFFVEDVVFFKWCFDSEWEEVDNTPHGAAYRLLYAMEYGIPDNIQEQQFDIDKYIFRNFI